MSDCTEILNLNNGKKFKLPSLDKMKKAYPESTFDKKKCVFGTPDQKAGKVVCDDTTAGKKRVFDKEGGKCIVPTAKMCEDKKIIKEGSAYILVTKSSRGKAVDCAEFRGVKSPVKKSTTPVKKTTPAKKGEKKECREDQVENPDTKKCVSRTGKLGMKILGKTAPTPKKAEKKKAEVPTKCEDAASGKKRVLNKETGKCAIPTAAMCKDKKIIKEGDLYILVTKNARGKAVDCDEFRGVGAKKSEEKATPKAKAEKGKKECREDQVENPDTKKCVSRTGKLGKKILGESTESTPKTKKPVKCPADKVFNPDSEKCVSKTGAIGKKILAAKAAEKKAAKPKKECREDQVENPDTGKCVSKTGSIGKKVLAAKGEKVSKKDEESSSDTEVEEKPKASKKATKKAGCEEDPKACREEGKVCKKETGKCVKVTREQLKTQKLVKEKGTFVLSKTGKSLASTPKEAEELMAGDDDSAEESYISTDEKDEESFEKLFSEDEDDEEPPMPSSRSPSRAEDEEEPPAPKTRIIDIEDDEEESYISTEEIVKTKPETFKTTKDTKIECPKDSVYNMKTKKCNKLDSWTEGRLKKEGFVMKSIDGVRYVGPKAEVNALSTKSCPASKVLDADEEVCISKPEAAEKVKEGSDIGIKRDGKKVVGEKSNVKAAGAVPVKESKKEEVVEELESEASEERSFVETGEESVSADTDVLSMQQSREKLLEKIKQCMQK